MAKRPRFLIQIGGLVVVLAVTTFVANATPNVFKVKYDKPVEAKNFPEEPKIPEKPKIVVTHLSTPEPVKAIYMSQCVVGSKKFREKLVDIADTTEVNSIVIDIKDFTGRVSFDTDNPAVAPAISDKCGASDMLEFIDELHKKNIYVIGRITVFQDPFVTSTHPELAVKSIASGGVWKDFKGLSFVDVGARLHWDYIVELSKEAYKIGFDELNFDYIRFPSDGKMNDTFYSLSQGKTKPDALEEFFIYLHDSLKPIGVVISADLFGMVTTSRNDLNIGQVLEKALPHFDYVSPMVYPSHYPDTFNGWANPDDHPYELIKFTMGSAVERANEFDHSFASSSPQYNANSYKKLRPWIQDFDYGGNYDVAEVKAQLKATYDVGLTSWMLWAPSNIYTVGALDKQQY